MIEVIQITKDASAKHFQENVVGGKLPKELHMWPKNDADKDESAEEDDDAKEDDSNLTAAQTNQDQGKTKTHRGRTGLLGRHYICPKRHRCKRWSLHAQQG